jgi:uncharacterized protein (TIGR02145 family)
LLTSDNTDLNSTTNPNITNNGGVLEFTLPQLVTSGSSDFDNPYAYGPVTGDTGTGATNYGYLYNWSAATAGESQTTMPAGSGDAANSICPAGWHLPSGGDADSADNDFSYLNARMAGFADNQDSTYLINTDYYTGWQYDGSFKGVFSGNWFAGGFNAQGDLAHLWSRSASPVDSGNAFRATFYSYSVMPGYNGTRSPGNGVRCLLNN